MQEFTAEYMPSSIGLIRARPAAARELGLDNRGNRIWFVAVLVLVFGASFAQSFILPQLSNTAMLAIIAALWLAYFIFALPSMQTRLARRFDELAPPSLTKFAADSAGLQIADATSLAHWKWHDVRGALKTPEGVAILIGYSVTFVPAGAFKDDAEQAEFVELVTRNANKK